jgi:tRNA threonylcarbamoyladenosine biosynthesis protein TsaE
MIFVSRSEKETFNFAKSLSDKIKPGNIFLVEGNLGVGKSVFIRGAARGLGVKDSMPSPSFTIVNEYIGKFPVYHFDFYRINNPVELFEIGFEEYIYSNGVSFIEWPSKAGELLPVKCIKVKIDFKNDERVINIKWKE